MLNQNHQEELISDNDYWFSKKYQPLFELLEDPNNHPKVDTVILTGGRGSGKSQVVATFANEAVLHEGWKILYSRFTNTSVEDSIKAEFDAATEERGYEDYLKTHKKTVVSICDNEAGERGHVSFKGLKPSSKQSSANLKSIKGFNCWILDEAEEAPSNGDFKKVYLSIRSKKKRNLTILILNPTSYDHWIYEEFFKDVPDGYCGIRENVMYIHSTYLDLLQAVPDALPQNIIDTYEREKINDIDTYDHVILGGWLRNVEGALYKNIKRYKKSNFNYENVDHKLGYIDVADEGTDNFVFVVVYVVGNCLYVEDVICTSENTDFTIPASIAMAKKHGLEYLWIESNGAGSVVAKEISKKLWVTGVMPFYNGANKHTRIISNSFFVQSYVYIQEDYEVGSDYEAFYKRFKVYNKDKSKNEFDDEADALSGIAEKTRAYLPYLWE